MHRSAFWYMTFLEYEGKDIRERSRCWKKKAFREYIRKSTIPTYRISNPIQAMTWEE